MKSHETSNVRGMRDGRKKVGSKSYANIFPSSQDVSEHGEIENCILESMSRTIESERRAEKCEEFAIRAGAQYRGDWRMCIVVGKTQI